eukprot:SAG31_NODE_1411_length_8466_cov_18.216565_9_plen_116_part_00
MTTNYWSPAATDPELETRDPKASMLLGDGGSTDNAQLIALLQRKLSKVVVIFQGDTPLATNSTWNVRKREVPDASEFDSDIPAYFGINIPQPGQDLKRAQVGFNLLPRATCDPGH